MHGACLMAFFCLSNIPTFAQGEKIDSSNVVTLRIDPQTARGAAVSQIFDEVKFVPLETTKESLFGQISQFKVVNNLYLIYDYDTKAVLIFAPDGKFLTKIDGSKLQSDKNDKEKAQFYGFNTEKEDDENYIIIFTPNNVQYFNFSGKFVKKKPNKDYKYSNESKFEDGTTVKQNFYLKKGVDSTFYQLGLARKKTLDTVAYFKNDKNKFSNDDYYSYPNFYKANGDFGFYIDSYSYDIFKVTSQKVSLAYKLIFPALNSLPSDFMTNPIYIKKRSEYFDRNKKVFIGIGAPYLLGDNLYLKMSTMHWDKDQKRNVIYNLKTSETISFQDLEPDSLSSFLPITDSGFGYDFESRGFLAFEDGKFFTSYSALAMFTFKERSAGKDIAYPPLLTNYFKTNDRRSNPVLIILKPKQN